MPTLVQIEEYHLTRDLSSPYVVCLFNPTPGWLGNTKVEPRKCRFLLWRGTPETNMFFKRQLQKLPSSRNQPCKGGVFNIATPGSNISKTSLKNHLFKVGGLMILMVSCPPKNDKFRSTSNNCCMIRRAKAAWKTGFHFTPFPCLGRVALLDSLNKICFKNRKDMLSVLLHLELVKSQSVTFVSQLETFPSRNED